MNKYRHSAACPIRVISVGKLSLNGRQCVPAAAGQKKIADGGNDTDDERAKV